MIVDVHYHMIPMMPDEMINLSFRSVTVTLRRFQRNNRVHP